MTKRQLGLWGPVLLMSACAAGCGGSSTGSDRGAIAALDSPAGWRVEKDAAGVPQIRVLLHENVKTVAVAVDGPYEIRQGATVVQQGPKMARTPLRAVGGAALQVQIGKTTAPPGDIDIMAQGDGTLRLYAAARDGADFSRYDGRLRILSDRPPAASGDGPRANVSSFNVVNVVSLERYLPGVLEAELYPDWHVEAHRAQAIAARTYALYQMQTFGRTTAFDVRATEASQVYRGWSGAGPVSKAERASRDTRGIVCTWTSPLGERIFCTYFSSACGGGTQPAWLVFDVPRIGPLAGGVPCDYCRIGRRVYRWGPVRISKSEVRQRLVARFPRYGRLGQIRRVTQSDPGPDGRMLKVRIADEHGRKVVVDSYQFRLAMGGHRVMSNYCTIVDRGGALEFRDGRGFGHAVGLCQWGTEGQARVGRRASEIIAYYYPGSHLRRAY